jgi:Sec-independent protein translocase protein TatA
MILTLITIKRLYRIYTIKKLIKGVKKNLQEPQPEKEADENENKNETETNNAQKDRGE